MSTASIILALVTLQRLGELVLARRNTQRLMARGAVEVGAGHYPLLVAMHAAWLIALWIYGYDQPVDPIPLIAFIGLQGLRCWVSGDRGLSRRPGKQRLRGGADKRSGGQARG